MHLEKIPQYEWNDFLRFFSQQHRMWYVYIEKLNEIGFKEILSENKHLKRISINLDGYENSMEINLENKSGAKSDYRIESVKEIFLLEEENNINEGLKITTTGNQDILLKFRSTIQTSMLDGTIKK